LVSKSGENSWAGRTLTDDLAGGEIGIEAVCVIVDDVHGQ